MKCLSTQSTASPCSRICLEGRKYAHGSEIGREIADEAGCDRTRTTTDKTEHISRASLTTEELR